MREIIFQNLILDYMTKIRIFFSATLGIRIFFLEKNHNPPFKLNGRSLITRYFVIKLEQYLTNLIEQVE
jgi:hypothetical protein